MQNPEVFTARIVLNMENNVVSICESIGADPVRSKGCRFLSFTVDDAVTVTTIAHADPVNESLLVRTMKAMPYEVSEKTIASV